MGTFRVRLEIGDATGERWEAVEALVDTGATYTMLPAPVLSRSGVTPYTRDVFTSPMAAKSSTTSDTGGSA